MNGEMFSEPGPLKKWVALCDLLWEKLFHSLPQGVSEFHYAGYVEIVRALNMNLSSAAVITTTGASQ